MQDLPSLLQSFGVDLKKTGASYKCKCYVHDDKNPSMHVYQDDSGKWWAHCHSCTDDTHHDMIAAYMYFTKCDFKTADHDLQTGICKSGKVRGTITESPRIEKPNHWQWTFPPENSKPNFLLHHKNEGENWVKFNPAQVWTYRNADSKIVGYVARYNVWEVVAEHPDGNRTNIYGDDWFEFDDAQKNIPTSSDKYPDCKFYANQKKTFLPWTYGRLSVNIKPKWSRKVWYDNRPLYNADKLAKSTGQVVIVEGEKAADAASKLFPASIACITWPGGSGGVRYADWSALKDRKAILIPDADPSGVAAMEWLAKHLLGNVKALSVASIDTSDQPQGWDLADALDSGWDQERTLAWAREHKSIATLEPVNQQAAKQAVIERAKSMEKKTPENSPPEQESSLPALSIVPPLETVTLETEPIPVVNGNVISMQAQRLDLSPQMPPEFSEVAMARSWSETYGMNWRYIAAWDTWMFWDGFRWEIDKRNSITRKAADAMVAASNWQSAQILTIGQKRSLCSKKFIANVLYSASPDHTILPEELDADPFLLGTPDGIINLRTGEIRPAKPEDLITKITKVSPKRGDMPHWEKAVLDRCTNGNPEMREYYQRWVGYMLTGDCREEGFIFIHGPGNSGKSKFVDCIGDLMGDYCTTAKVEMLMESRFERHTEEIACLAGARMVRTSEPEEGSRWNEALLKLLTGRDTISARRLYEKQFTFKPQFKLVMSGNFRPALKSTGEEIRRRMHFVEFPNSIPENERIYDLPERLQEEWPAILQWAIDGCIKWQKHGLGRPETVVKSTKEYLADEDTLGQWIEECCIVESGARVQVSDAYHSYKKRAEHHGEGVTSMKRFSQRVESRGFARIKVAAGRSFTGIRLRNDYESWHHDDRLDRDAYYGAF